MKQKKLDWHESPECAGCMFFPECDFCPLSKVIIIQNIHFPKKSKIYDKGSSKSSKKKRF